MHKIFYEVYILLALTVFPGATELYASTYYVSPSGNNSNNGLNPGNAFLTIQHAANLMQAGDTVYVANGNYTGFDFRGFDATASDPTAFLANGNSVIINDNGPIRQDGINIEDSDYTIIAGFIVTGMTGNGNGVRVVTSNHCVIRSNTCEANSRGIFTGFTDDILIEHNTCSDSYYEHGIYVSNSSDRPIIRYNQCNNNAKAGLHFNGDLSAGGDGIISDPEIYGNRLFDNNLGSAINCDGVVGAKIFNNLIYNNHSSQGIVLFQTDGAVVSSNAKIFNNTIIVPSDGRWGILIQAGANVGTVLYNNIIYNQHATRGCIAVVNTAQFTSDYNIVNNRMSLNGDSGPVISLSTWQSNGFDQHSMNSSSLTALFLDFLNQDFHLSATSIAVDAGTNMASTLTSVDFDNENRPSGSTYDIGCYEYVQSTPNAIQEESTSLFHFYPNPVTSHFRIDSKSFESINQILVIDLRGQIIKRFNPVAENLFSISDLPDGIYFIQVISKDQQRHTEKIIKR